MCGSTEPPPASTPLLAHPRVIANAATTAGVTHESRERGGRMAAEVFVEAARRARAPPRVLNPQVSEVFERRLARGRNHRG
jgi:phosphoglycerate dehydrogenase-like enzyme